MDELCRTALNPVGARFICPFHGVEVAVEPRTAHGAHEDPCGLVFDPHIEGLRTAHPPVYKGEGGCHAMTRGSRDRGKHACSILTIFGFAEGGLVAIDPNHSVRPENDGLRVRALGDSHGFRLGNSARKIDGRLAFQPDLLTVGGLRGKGKPGLVKHRRTPWRSGSEGKRLHAPIVGSRVRSWQAAKITNSCNRGADRAEGAVVSVLCHLYDLLLAILRQRLSRKIPLMRVSVASPVACFLTGGCLDLPEVDLEGPTVVTSNLEAERNVAFPVYGSFVVEFSKTVSRGSIHARSVVLIPWEDRSSCARTPICEDGRCEAGRCQIDPLSKADLSRINQGLADPERTIPVNLRLVEGEFGLDSRLVVTPERALRPHSRHSLVVGEAVRGLALASIEDRQGRSSAWRGDFVTGSEGASGPEPRLVSPRPGEQDVPTNLREIEIHFARPVAISGKHGLRLEAEDGLPLDLDQGEPCTGWVLGFCLRWFLPSTLEVGTRYRPWPLPDGVGVLRDPRGLAAVPPHRIHWFRTGTGPDTRAPELDIRWAGTRARCLVVGIMSTETLEIVLRARGLAHRIKMMAGEFAIGLPLESLSLVSGDVLSYEIRAMDLAGNESEFEGSVAVDDNFTPGLPRWAVSEILANPAGPEPDQEFLEIVALEDKVGMTSSGEIYLSDLPWSEVVAALVAGEDPPGDALLGLRDWDYARGDLALLISAKYVAGAGADPSPAPGTFMVRLDASLAKSGLKNAGEPISLYRAEPPALLASYGNFIDTSASSHSGRSVTMADLRGCDVASNWRSHPSGESSPGRLP